eukprot:4792105-Amphidinium_carterae.2
MRLLPLCLLVLGSGLACALICLGVALFRPGALHSKPCGGQGLYFSTPLRPKPNTLRNTAVLISR